MLSNLFSDPLRSEHVSTCRVDQAEDIIENKVASLPIRQQLKDLRVVHWPLFLVDLAIVSSY